MEIKGYTVEDSYGATYWVGAQTPEQAIALVQEDLDRITGFSEEDKKIVVLTESVKEIDPTTVHVLDDEVGCEVSMADEILTHGVGLVGCSEW